MRNLKEKKFILQDYDRATITLLWCLHEEKRKLIFSSVELFPKECVDFYEIDEQSIELRIGDTKPHPRMFYRRICISAKDALELYSACEQGSFEMIWETEKNNDGTLKRILSSSMRQVPAWSNFTLSKNSKTELCPFLAESWGMCRVHHLMSEKPDPFIMQIAAHENSLAWIRDRLLWNIYEFPELLGSMHLILPNPVYRYLEEKLIPNEDGKPEKVNIHFVLRKGQTTAGLKLITAERMPFGIANVKKYAVRKSSMTISLSGKAEEFATAVFCNKRGLLEYSEFANFLRGICVNMEFVRAIREVNIPNSDEAYQVPITEDETIQIGNKPEENIIDLGQKLTMRAWKKKKEQLADKLSQHLFLNDTQKEATEFIAEIIRKARHRIIIVDPYFATIELYKYVFRITSRNVEIEIITSAETLNEKTKLVTCADGKPLKKGQVLLREIKAHAESISEKPISVLVMTGTPLIHDRFLAVDDQVWFSGNSLNNIGKRTSMIIKLANPDEVLDLIDDLRKNTNRVKTLEEWAKNCESNGDADEKQNTCDK